MDNIKILLVEDDEAVSLGIEYNLKNEGFEVIRAADMTSAKQLFNEEFKLILLDIGLPDGNGYEFCKYIREKSKVPIIFLTALDEEVNVVLGFDLGGDDYIIKPFRPLELVARVKAQLRRYKKYNQGMEKSDNRVIFHSGLVIDTNTHEVLLNEKPLSLTPTEFSILRILCEHKGSVVSSEKLFHEIWGDEYFTKNNNTITVHIRHLREKMDDVTDNPKYIKTVWGVGYKIEK